MTEQEEGTAVSRPVRITVLVVVAMLVAMLVAWFFFAWLALDRHVLDAAGESVGSGLLLLIIVSVIGMVLKRG